MTETYDLHSHSTASDGALSPTELVERAFRQGVTRLALTDHDTVNGLSEAGQAAQRIGMRLIPGIELSSLYHSHCLHVVGLGIDPHHPVLLAGLQRQQAMRAERAEKIAVKLEKKRIAGAYQAVSQAAGDGMITRSHFADFLVAERYVATAQEAFDRYLGQGKPAYVATAWAALGEVVEWIDAAGGVAVLAHPLRYKLTAKWLKRALTAFKDAGGLGIEVVTGRGTPEETAISAAYAFQYELFGSAGSDFHSPDNPWVELGRLQSLPSRIKPVWQLFESGAVRSTLASQRCAL